MKKDPFIYVLVLCWMLGIILFASLHVRVSTPELVTHVGKSPHDGSVVAPVSFNKTGDLINFKRIDVPSTDFVVDVYSLINQFRVVRGLNNLNYNAQLAVAAQERADSIAKTGRFSHTDPDGTYPFLADITKTGYQGAYRGENLAEGYQTADEVVAAWENSPEHLANILGTSYVDTGLGVAEGVYKGKEVTFVVQLFANRK